MFLKIEHPFKSLPSFPDLPGFPGREPSPGTPGRYPGFCRNGREKNCEECMRELLGLWFEDLDLYGKVMSERTVEVLRCLPWPCPSVADWPGLDLVFEGGTVKIECKKFPRFGVTLRS